MKSIVLLILLTIFPQLKAEDRVVVFARENPEGDWASMTSTVWQCVVPDDRDRQMKFERKLDFGKSHWAPSLFFFHGPENWLRVQRHTGVKSRDFEVSLVAVNYQTWDTKHHFTFPRLSENGFTEKRGYLHDGKGSHFTIDFETGDVSPAPDGFHLYRDFGAYWLVKFDESERTSYHLINPDSAERSHLIDPGVELKSNLYQCDLKDDGPVLALCLHQLLEPDTPFGKIGTIGSELQIRNFDTGELYRYSFTSFATAGSGYPTLPHFRGSFSGDFYEFYSVDQNGKERFSKLDLSNGKVTHTAIASAAKIGEQKQQRRIPDYLKSEYRKLERIHWPEQALAHLFVMKFSDLEYEIPETWADTAVAWSKDGNRFLMNMRSSPLPSEMFYGNLSTKELRICPCPKELERRPIEFHFLN